MSFDNNFFNNGYFWTSYGAWRSVYAVVPELWTSPILNLKKAVEKKEANLLKPGESVSTEVKLKISSI